MSYPVGTICIGQKHTHDLHLNGMACVVESPIEHYVTWCPHENRNVAGDFYEVRWANGQLTSTEHKNLKRKDRYNEGLRSEIRAGTYTKDRANVSKLISGCLKAAKAGVQV